MQPIKSLDDARKLIATAVEGNASASFRPSNTVQLVTTTLKGSLVYVLEALRKTPPSVDEGEHYEIVFYGPTGVVVITDRSEIDLLIQASEEA